MSNAPTFLSKVFPILFYATIAIFVAILLFKIDYSVLATIEFNWWIFTAASLIALAFRYFGAYTWTVILRSLGATNATFNRKIIYVYAKSWLGRYIPGAVPWILGKIYFAAKLGISKNKLATSSLLEGLLQIIVTLVLSLIILLFDNHADMFIPTELRYLMVLMIVGSIIMLLPKVFNTIVSLAYKLVKKRPFPKEHAATNATIIRGTALYIAGAFIGGISFLLLAKSVYSEIGLSEALYILGVSNLANAVSMLAVFAPSGIGVREGIQIALLSAVMPVEIAIVIAIITRLWGIAIDGVFFLAAKAPLIRQRSA